MAKSDVEVMVPKTKRVKISGKEYDVRPFNMKDVIHFTRDLFEGFSKIQSKYPSLNFDTKNPAEMLKFMPLLLDEAPRLFGLFARAIEKDGTWLENQSDIGGVSELFLAITEINDFGIIISNFKAGWSNLQKMKVQPTV
jgi:hypothetical protein